MEGEEYLKWFSESRVFETEWRGVGGGKWETFEW